MEICSIHTHAHTHTHTYIYAELTDANKTELRLLQSDKDREEMNVDA